MNPIIFKRVAITAGTAVVINFDVSGVRKYLVKNLTDGDVYFGTSQEKSEMILIPAGCAQIIELSDAGAWMKVESTNLINERSENL